MPKLNQNCAKPTHPRGPSVLRWAGSKTKSLNHLAQHWTRGKVYVEPFCGSAALFFHLEPRKAQLSDLNSELINALKCLRQNPDRLWRSVTSYRRDEETYYRNRLRFNSGGLDDLTAASLFIYLNRNCFNGLWRTNKAGLFNVPFGGKQAGTLPALAHFRSCAALLKRAKITTSDFRVALSSNISENSFIYVDPPYFSSNIRVFVDYNSQTFCERDFDDLIDLLCEADGKGAQFVLSYKDSRKIRLACKRWTKRRVIVTRNVGGFASSRKRDNEIIVTNVEN